MAGFPKFFVRDLSPPPPTPLLREKKTTPKLSREVRLKHKSPNEGAVNREIVKF